MKELGKISKFMKIKFQPLPGLSIVVVICLTILLALGTWQYKRLIWKTNVIKNIESAANAEPITSLVKLNDVLLKGESLDFRRVSLSLNFEVPQINAGQPFHLLRSNGKSFSWRLYQPASQLSEMVYVATREFTETQKQAPPKPLAGTKTILGYVRSVQHSNWTIPKSNAVTNRWFAFNADPKQLDWRGSQNIQTAYYIDHAEHITKSGDLNVRIPEIPNNHLDYMLTWYSFALILLIIYALIHKKYGRLRIERK